eukprot:gb/GEZN01001682.1/.p1 GENE.gb/GEZN01001682.1/~~gb/GEZN01001682.1/.p1  ORF type:complete len:737 (-),score=59.24 gb/GEZN01001682.1/:643-2853(-)
MFQKKFPDILQESENCREFLSRFVDPETQARKYLDLLQAVANRQVILIKVFLDDVLQFRGDAEFVNRIKANTSHYLTLFSKAADGLMPEPTQAPANESQHDVYLNQRNQRLAAVRSEDDTKSKIPVELTRRFQLVIIPQVAEACLKLREIKARSVGGLVQLQGIVTRTTEVKPLMRVCTYICGLCGYESYQTIADRQYSPLSACPSEVCKQNQTEGKLFSQTRGSHFVKFQEVKLQEMPTEVPVGHIPRAITLRCYGELTRLCKPGDLVTVAGIYLPAPRLGFRAMRAGLTAETYINVQDMVPHKKTYVDFEFTPELMQEVEEKSEEKDVYETLAHSIAPEIYGHLDVKKCLLLLLVGGVTRSLPDVTIRGDINVLLMGDPGVAKSQLLKHITRIAPRAVYTTGKGSSGVGLTAAVIRDQMTGEVTLEGGALVLADKGICCIDEFDKMEDADRTAIHEVMEQQTVSIAKAGITTTLNARTSVLAAANPLMGRWNNKISPERNLGLPASLLSRFDLTFILLDKPEESFDQALAKHVTYVHRMSAPPPLEFEPLPELFLRAYIARARHFEPYVPIELAEYIIQSYVGMRSEGVDEEGGPSMYKGEGRFSNNRQRFCTPRALLSILRLSQALARLHFRNEIQRDDCEEAMRLMAESKRTDDDKEAKKTDSTSAIYQILKSYFSTSGKKSLKKADLENQVFTRGFTAQQLQVCLDEYVNLGIFNLSSAGATISLVPDVNL